jgi:hypothetical protein
MRAMLFLCCVVILCVYIVSIDQLRGMKPMPVKIIEVQESYGTDFYVYAGSKLIRVCPSIGMAREVAAAYQ